jgi:hypothetical protein
MWVARNARLGAATKPARRKSGMRLMDVAVRLATNLPATR